MDLGQVTIATTSSSSSSGPGAFITLGIVAIFVILQLIGFWKTLEKGGESGAWALLLLTGCLYPVAFVPIAKLSGRPGWWVVLLYIPLVNIVVLAILSIDLAKSFGRGTGYGIGLWLLGWIFYPMLGLGSSTYQGPAGPVRA
jgi:hypothetical protein